MLLAEMYIGASDGQKLTQKLLTNSLRFPNLAKKFFLNYGQAVTIGRFSVPIQPF